MDFDDIFAAYYTQYRVVATVPTSSDDEYTIALELANEAVRRWSRYDGTYWKELFTTLQSSTQVTPALVRTTASNVATYAAPTDMKEPGGFVRLKNASGQTQTMYPILEPQDVQFRDDNSQYCYFVGNPNSGFTLHLNPAPTGNLVGLTIDYVYYKNPTLFTSGTDKTEMSEPYFVVHRMLANRFRGSRNPYYDSAKTDAEDALKTMQADNNSGNWANPWKLADNTGANFGDDSYLTSSILGG